MPFGSLLFLLGIAQIGLALRAGPFAWLLAWSGVSWALAGGGYVFIGPKTFGKRLDGRMNRGNVLLLLPFLVVIWLLWHLQIALTREPRHVEVAPGLWLGRRCFGHELPPGIKMIVDLTAEFSEQQAVREGRHYHCLPTLDASVPSFQDFHTLLRVIESCQDPVYIHCAQGHGRSATVVMAALLARGLATSLEEAEKHVKQARPGIRINTIQRRLLQDWWTAQQTLKPGERKT